MKKKTRVIGFGAIAIAAIVAILLNNRAQMQASSRNDLITSYPVSVVQASTQELTLSLSLSGTVTANNDVAIVSETSGRVTRVFADVGDYKPAGSVLLQL